MSRYILTDAGNVITRFKFRAQLVAEIVAAFGINNLDLADIFRTKAPVSSDEEYYRGLDEGEFHVYDIWECVVRRCRNLREVCSYPLFFSLWCRHLEPIEGVVKLYRELQKTFPLVVVSNGDAEGVRHLIYYLAGTYKLNFEGVFISGERKRKKPELLSDVLTFLQERNVSPAKCVFIDDIKPYVVAAEKLDIPGIMFDGRKQSAQELQEALAKLGFALRPG